MKKLRSENRSFFVLLGLLCGMEIFYAMREELRFYLKRTQLLETILAENGIPIPDYDD